MDLCKLVLLGLIAVVAVSHVVSSYRVVCYYPNWAYWRGGIGKLTIKDVDPNLCTHIVYAFVVLDGATYTVKPHDKYLDVDLSYLNKFTALKEKNPKLKALVALGGWNDSQGNKYSLLVADPANRESFIAHAKEFVKKYNFDGLDLNWGYPGHNDKAGFAAWVKELHEAFAPEGLEVTAAVSASTDKGYDIPVMSKYLDAIHLMEYNMHGSWESATANHHAPLYGPGINVNKSVNSWISKGASPSKLVLGIPTYGRSWKLSGSDVTPPAPAQGAAPAGRFTREAGIMAYYEICSKIKDDGWKKETDPENNMGPWAYKLPNWVGYDDPAMAKIKAEYIISKGLGGAMFWDLAMDDFKNTCGGGKNPIINTVRSTLCGEGDGCGSTTVPPETTATTAIPEPSGTAAATSEPPGTTTATTTSEPSGTTVVATSATEPSKPSGTTAAAASTSEPWEPSGTTTAETAVTEPSEPSGTTAGAVSTSEPSEPSGTTVATTSTLGPSETTAAALSTSEPSGTTGAAVSTSEPSEPSETTVAAMSTSEPLEPSGTTAATMSTSEPSGTTAATMTTLEPSETTAAAMSTSEPSEPSGTTAAAVSTSEPSEPSGTTAATMSTSETSEPSGTTAAAMSTSEPSGTTGATMTTSHPLGPSGTTAETMTTSHPLEPSGTTAAAMSTAEPSEPSGTTPAAMSTSEPLEPSVTTAAAMSTSEPPEPSVTTVAAMSTSEPSESSGTTTAAAPETEAPEATTPSSQTTATMEPPPGPEFTCPNNGLFPDPNDCSSFYHCGHDTVHHKPCPDGLFFNPDLKICDWPQNVACEDSIELRLLPLSTNNV